MSFSRNQTVVTRYWSGFGIGIQNNFAYRVNSLARARFGLIPLLVTRHLWQTIFSGQGVAASPWQGSP